VCFWMTCRIPLAPDCGGSSREWFVPSVVVLWGVLRLPRHRRPTLLPPGSAQLPERKLLLGPDLIHPPMLRRTCSPRRSRKLKGDSMLVILIRS
jgi:hypothetical protein